MCLTISDHGREPSIATADKHYLVWKRLIPATNRQNMSEWLGISPYQQAYYFNAEIKYSNLCVSTHRAICANVPDRHSVEEGLHALRSRNSPFWKNEYTETFPALIPRGSKLYYGDKDDVVSNQLIVFRDMKELKKWAEKN